MKRPAPAEQEWSDLWDDKPVELMAIGASTLGGMFGKDSQVGAALSGAGNGMMMGMQFGPMGALAGGILGGLSPCLLLLDQHQKK